MAVSLDVSRGEDRHRWIERAVAVAGLTLVAIAIGARQSWLDRHFLPSFFVTRDWYVRAETIVRVAICVAGLVLGFAAIRLGRFIGHAPRRAAAIALAAMLGLVASEFVLRHAPPRPIGWLVPSDEPRREPDARLGWVLARGRVGRATADGRAIDYAIDANGYRVRSLDEPVDRERPTIVFGGESVMFGEGLAWNETIPAQVGAMLHAQSANVAVHGYSTDQTYLRLEHELTLFRRPLAVVSLFMTTLLGRNMDDDRPHLAPGLVWIPPQPASRLRTLVGLLVPYRRTETIDNGIAMTRQVLQSTTSLARSRGAEALVVVPQIGSESAPEQALRHRVFDGSGIPYVLIEVDPEWRLDSNRHPDARAAKLVARVIAGRLGGK